MSETLTVNSNISHYRIVCKLGAGGMGEVYRARDTRLDREVAIKVLPADFAKDADRLKRFEQEARATSALNHPNILTVYDIGTHDGSPYIVAELLEGQELRHQLNEGAIPSRKAIDYAQQIASGLAAAHEKGITHRDLKPENILVTTNGRLKILDFGLAKLRTQRSEPAGSQVATEQAITDPGIVMGTAGYMSPEQVRGQQVDHRSDIFSFGVILYEMLSGRRAFTGDSTIEVMNAILKEEPPELLEIISSVPIQLERIVARCLEKSPGRRFQSASDMGFALEALSTVSGSRASVAQTSATDPLSARSLRFRNRERLVWITVTALLLLALLALAYSYFGPRPLEAHTVRSHIPPPEKASFKSAGLNAGPVTVSPDGRRLAFVATSEEGNSLLWVRSLSALTAQSLAGTEGAYFPFWSPDNRSLGFFAGGKLKKIDAAGGPVFVLCDAPAGRGGTWNQDGVIVFAPDNLGPLYRVSASGGASSIVTILDMARGEGAHRWPYFLPDGKHFLYLGASLAFNASVDDAIHIASLDGGESKLVMGAGSNVAYAQGFLLFVREPSLRAQPFDLARLETVGDDFPIAEQVLYDVASTNGVFSVSESGVLVYQTGSAESGTQLTWYDRNGKMLGVVGDLARFAGACLSPGGTRVVMDLPDAHTNNIDIWLMDLARGVRTRFTFDGGIDISPLWSPDGSRIAFASGRKDHLDLYQKASNGVGREEPLLEDDLEKLPQSWSPDGRFLLYYARSGVKGESDLWVLPLAGDGKPFPITQTEYTESVAKFSPDGLWIAYESDESGKAEVYVTRFRGPEGKRQVSAYGGSQPRWRSDGAEIFFLSPDRTLMAAEVRGRGDSLEIVGLRRLFQTRATGPGYQYDVTADGKRFLVNTEVDQKVFVPLTLVQNWTADFKR